jgi:lysophospholipase L1-like esterase
VGCHFIDLQPVFDQITETIDPQLLTKDGVHPTQMGAGLIADTWWKYVGGQAL